MALSQQEKDMLNELFMQMNWLPDPHARLVELGASESMIRKMLKKLKKDAKARAQRRKDKANAELARLNAVE